MSSWCLVIAVWLFLAVPWVCLQSVIVVFPDHTHLLFLTLLIAYKNEPYSPTPGRISWLLFSDRDISWGHTNPSCTTFSLVSCLLMALINVNLLALKIATQHTRLIGCFPIVLMKIFKLNMFNLDISINCRHLWGVYLIRVTCVTFFYKSADNDFIDCILE